MTPAAQQAGSAPGVAPAARIRSLSADEGVQPFHPVNAAEQGLLEAFERRRANASASIQQLFGVDLEALVADPRRQELVVARVGDEAWRSLAVLDALSEVLAAHDVGHTATEPDRSRLVWTSDGVDANFVPTPPVVVPLATRYSPARADAYNLGADLAAGRSFVVKALDEHVDRLGRAVEEIETVLGARSSVLAYLGGPGAVGWGPHYDNHNVLVAQVAGTKRWAVHEPVEARPLRPHSEYRASGRVVWEGTLEPGDVLFIPRGWGHDVRGTDEPSVHVTLPLRVRTGAQLLEMIAGQAPLVADLRRDVPVGRVGEAARVDALLSDANLHRALASWRARMPSRARNRLTAVDAAIDALATGADPPPCRLRLSAPGGFHRPVGGDAEPRVVTAGRCLLLDEAEVRALARLVDGTTFAELAETNDAPHALVAALLDVGLLRLDRPDGGPTSEVAPPRARVAGVFGRGRGSTELAAVRVLGAAFPDPGARPLDAAVGWEAELARAAAEGRRAAIAALTSRLDLDLPDALAQTRAPAPRQGRLTAEALAELDPLAVVDQVVAHHDLAGDKVKLARDHDPRNRPAPPDLFVAPYSTFSPTLLDVGSLRRQLRSATTLIALGIEEDFPHLARWVARIERVTGRRSGINAYVSHGQAPGFGAHWDDHDVLIVHVAGTKQWTLRPPLEPRTMRPYSSVAVSDEIAWSGTVTPGDVLFIPRGWGHSVSSDGGWSVHFTLPLRSMHAAAILEHAATGAGLTGAQRADVAVGVTPPPWTPDDGHRAIEESIAFWRARVPARVHQPLGAFDALRTWAPGAGVRLAAATGAHAARGTGHAGADHHPTEHPVVLADRLVAVAPSFVPVLAHLLAEEQVMLDDLPAEARPALEVLATGQLLQVVLPEAAP